MNETTKTATKVHVQLGEDVQYNLDATRTDITAPYLGKLVTSEEDSFDVSCR
jgi:hypothetical protein